MLKLNARVMHENARAGPVKFSITGARTRYRHRSLYYAGHVWLKEHATTAPVNFTTLTSRWSDWIAIRKTVREPRKKKKTA